MRTLIQAFDVLADRVRRSVRGPAPPSGPPKVPPGTVVYAIGDIHGELRLLDDLLDAIRADAERLEPARRVVVFLGDYVDRGPDSRGVLDRLIGRPLPGFETHFLMGNHEAAMLDFLEDPVAAMGWLRFGGLETLGSYGALGAPGTVIPARCMGWRDALKKALPPAHLDFLRALNLYVVVGDYAFVHAGIRPGRPLDAQVADDLLWMRDPFLTDRRRHEKVIVHGHTVVDAPELLENRIAVDTGAYASGVLTALVLNGEERRFLQARR